METITWQFCFCMKKCNKLTKSILHILHLCVCLVDNGKHSCIYQEYLGLKVWILLRYTRFIMFHLVRFFTNGCVYRLQYAEITESWWIYNLILTGCQGQTLNLYCSSLGVASCTCDPVFTLGQRLIPTPSVYFAAIPLGKGLSVHYLVFSDGS